MTNSKGASIFFTKSDEVAKGASWQQLAKARNRRKVGLAGEPYNLHQTQHTTEDGENPLKVLEEKIKEERMREERGAHSTHQTKLPEKETAPEPFDEFEDDFPPSFRTNQNRGD